MTAHARGRRHRVVIIDVAIGTLPWRDRVHSRKGKSSGVVVECRVCPGRGVMALLTGLREIRRNMVGIRRSLKVFQVATHACRRADRVVVVDVTVGALPGRHGMHSREREVSKVVVECRIHPCAGGVTLVASLREIRSDVIGIRRSLEIFQVTSYASRAAEGVVAVDMAVSALARRYRVHSG